MQLSELGEFGFIERFKPLFANLVSDRQTGIGDDCAILPTGGSDEWLVTTDLLVEGVHFLREGISPFQLGHKSLAVSLSDIAAMGGHPVGSFLSIALPATTEIDFLDGFMEGYRQLSEQYHTPLLGGDTTRSPEHLTINVCVLGRCEAGKARKRDGAIPGDVIGVTGPLGDSAAGLHFLLNPTCTSSEVSYLLEKHLCPEPRVKEGRLLAQCSGVHAMMDLSDGIASDLKHLLKASNVGANVCLDQIPLSEPMQRFSRHVQKDPIAWAIGGGEDYELLFTVCEADWEALCRQYREAFGKPLHRIGRIHSGQTAIDWTLYGVTIQPELAIFHHFTT